MSLPQPVLTGAAISLRPQRPRTLARFGTGWARAQTGLLGGGPVQAPVFSRAARQDYTIWLGETAIGEAGLTGITGAEAGCRLALWGHAWRNRGFAAQSLALMLAHAFERLGLQRITAEVVATDARALATYERAGFREVWRRSGAVAWEGVPMDMVGMAVTKEAWDAAAPGP